MKRNTTTCPKCGVAWPLHNAATGVMLLCGRLDKAREVLARIALLATIAQMPPGKRDETRAICRDIDARAMRALEETKP